MKTLDKYDEQLKALEARRDKAKKRLELKREAELMKEGKLKLKVHRYSYTYEGGYTGDEIITTDATEYRVFSNDVLVKAFRSRYQAVMFINHHRANGAQKKADQAVKRLGRRITQLKAELEKAESYAARLKTDVEIL